MNPTPEFQLEFLSKLQRLFAEGDFTATYKYALLTSLADLAVELGQDNETALEISFKQIGLKFIQLYWQQATPYKKKQVLAQNLGSQAAVVSAIEAFKRNHPAPTLHAAQGLSDFKKLLTTVTATVKAQPIQYLQNLGGGRVVFLFDVGRSGITLLPGIAYCLRRFQPLIQQLSRSHWIDHIKGNRRNSQVLSLDSDLESFLFETSRQALTMVSKGLRKIDHHCHYCGRAVNEADVDHFIPHALYPRDLIHNFVLAHPNCNRSKSDSLAARQHLERWLEFTTVNADSLSQIGYDAGINSDLASTNAVAQWGYANAVSNRSNAWLRASEYEAIDNGYLSLWT